MAQMMQKQRPDSVKPSQGVVEALESLVDILLAQIKEAPVSPEDLLARLNSDQPGCLAAVTGYMRRVGFLDGNELNRAALYCVLKIDLATGVGKRVSLAMQGEGLALYYFPGYTLETPLHQFLMQELTEQPLMQINIKHGKRRVVHARKNSVDQLVRSLSEAKQKYQSTTRNRLGVNVRRITIGEFLNLPGVIIERAPEIYQMLTRYGFSQGTGRVKL